MARSLIHIEGQTEEDFVNEVLRVQCPKATLRSKLALWAMLGFVNGAVVTDIMNHLREDRDCITTTMVDYQALPEKGPEGQPGGRHLKTLAYKSPVWR